MNGLLFTVFLIISSSLFAQEVDTECPAISENREKLIKDVKAKVGSRSRSTRQ